MSFVADKYTSVHKIPQDTHNHKTSDKNKQERSKCIIKSWYHNKVLTQKWEPNHCIMRHHQKLD
uniref:Uncharacterized protein n=1 Tax=Amphimedon queenslandica TaxID=400682 RepID=A0A1X7VUF3_AMPQE